MDDHVARYTRERWEALARADAVWTRPWLQLDEQTARARLDPHGLLGDVAGRRVLCLASGGGQQSVAFALLGAHVTVVDLSPSQLERDRRAAEHHGVRVETFEGDMRDLSRLEEASFDIVLHGYSINFVPDAPAVFRQVARVMRPSGIYHVMCANPFVFGLGTKSWNGRAYELTEPYLDGAVRTNEDEEWVLGDEKTAPSIGGSREYRHTLSTFLNGLAEHGFVLFHMEECANDDPDVTKQGEWDHFVSVAPPWLMFWTRYRPGIS